MPPSVVLDAESTVSLLDHLTALPGGPRRAKPSPAEALLGEEHPLCRSERELRSASGQLAGTASFVAAETVFARFHSIGAFAFVGVLVTGVVAIRFGTALLTRESRTVEAIAQGLEGVPLAHVQRERRSLLGERRRRRIAASLESYLPRSTSARGVIPLPEPPAVAVDGARDELRAVVELLRAGAPSEARGVASCQRLLSAYPSPLYDCDVNALRCELGRIRFLLLR